MFSVVALLLVPTANYGYSQTANANGHLLLHLQQVDSKELSLRETLVENLTTEKFDLGQYSDSYAKELEKLIQAKSEGQKVTIKEQEEEPKETTDILEALKASLKTKGKSSAVAKAKGKMGMAAINK